MSDLFRMGVKSPRGLLFLAALLLLGAVAYRIFGPEQNVAVGPSFDAPTKVAGCGASPFDEAQLAATHEDWADAIGDEFPITNFALRSVALGEVRYDGNTRDSIPPVGVPEYVAISQADIGDLEPVLSIGINDDFRAYPLRILLWHEIVNDVVGGVPVLVSYCPLCNSGVVFDRRVDGRVLEFGNTGRIRFHDMVMYDKGTESWWQQAMGEAMIGDLTGTCMQPLPARLESVARFRERAPNGKLLVPEDADARPYGYSPFRDMEKIPPAIARNYFPYDVPDGVDHLERVIVVGNQGWTVALIRDRGTLEAEGMVFEWVAGQNSIHDTETIAQGRDVGNVTVQRRTPGGAVDVAHDVTFAFTFASFHPDGTLHSLATAE